jgi:hypothetical protein
MAEQEKPEGISSEDSDDVDICIKHPAGMLMFPIVNLQQSLKAPAPDNVELPVAYSFQSVDSGNSYL